MSHRYCTDPACATRKELYVGHLPNVSRSERHCCKRGPAQRRAHTGRAQLRSADRSKPVQSTDGSSERATRERSSKGELRCQRAHIRATRQQTATSRQPVPSNVKGKCVTSALRHPRNCSSSNVHRKHARTNHLRTRRAQSRATPALAQKQRCIDKKRPRMSAKLAAPTPVNPKCRREECKYATPLADRTTAFSLQD